MATESKINVPSGFGGLMRFSEDYDSFFSLKPSHVVLFVIFVILFRFALEVIY